MVAARDKKIIIIECKSIKKNIAYLEEKEVENLKRTARHFGAECLFAIKHVKNKNWFIVSPENLEKKGINYRINLHP